MLQEKVAEVMDFITRHRVALSPGHPDGYAGEVINKAPCIDNPSRSASSDEAIIQSWLYSDENRTMFLPCGSKNNLLVVDCDMKDGINGHAQFLDYCARHQIEPSPVYQDTPSGGRHYFYRFDQRCSGNRTKIRLEGRKVNIDIKSEGGMIRVDPRNKTYIMTGCLQDAPLLPECLVAEIKVNPVDLYECDNEDAAKRASEYIANVKELVAAACAQIQKASIGERNDILNKMAYFVGRELAAGNKTEWETVKSDLLDAAKQAGLGERESVSTINGAFQSGVSKGGFRPNEKIPAFMRNLKFVRDNIVEEDGVFRRLPDTPIHIFGPNAKKVIKTISENRRVPAEMCMGLLIGLASVCLGNSCSIQYDRNWKEFTNLFLLFVGESGIGKSLAYAIIFEALLEKQGDQKEKFAQERQEYETKLAEWRKSRKTEIPKPIPPRNIQYVLNDSTVEGAIELLKDNPRGVSWYIDEGRKFFLRLDRYTNNSGDGRSKLLSGWDSQSISVMRKTHNNESNEIYIKRGTFSFISGIQPSFVPEFITNEDAEQGLTQRFLFIRAQEKAPPTYPLDEIPEEVDMRLRTITHKLLRLAELGEARNRLKKENGGSSAVHGFSDEENKWPTEFYLDSESKMCLDKDMTEKARTTFGTERYSYVKKSHKQTLRLALIIHLLTWAASDNRELSEDICYETIESAIKLINWFSQHLERILKLMPQQTKGQKIDNGTLNLIAEIIVSHIPDIRQSRNGFIPNKVWKKWLFDGNICLSNRSMRYLMDELHSVKHQTSSDRGRLFTEECLEYCEKLSEKPVNLFADEVDTDFNPELEIIKKQREKEAEKEAEKRTSQSEPVIEPDIVPPENQEIGDDFADAEGSPSGDPFSGIDQSLVENGDDPPNDHVRNIEFDQRE